MKPVLCIPSYSRPDGIAIERCKNLPLDKFLFIRTEQKDLYRHWKSFYTVVTQKNQPDIGLTRKNIVNFCANQGVEWCYILDDDIRKVELLGEKGDKITAQRILDGKVPTPGMEIEALKQWYRIARRFGLSLSSPNHRAYDRFHHFELTLNRSAVIQCVLLNVNHARAVGNYRSLKEVGNEDYYLQYKLMKAGYNTGKIGLMEYDVPSVGAGSGGCNATEVKDLAKRYQAYVDTFMKNVDSSNLITVKTTKTGVPSIAFNWKEWEDLVDSKYIDLRRYV